MMQAAMRSRRLLHTGDEEWHPIRALARRRRLVPVVMEAVERSHLRAVAAVGNHVPGTRGNAQHAHEAPINAPREVAVAVGIVEPEAGGANFGFRTRPRTAHAHAG